MLWLASAGGQPRRELAQRDEAAAPDRVQLLEDYLRRYPSGYFSELAQLELDRALARRGEKKIQITSQEGNPFTQGSAFTRIANVGDTYTYRELDMRTMAERRTYTVIVIQVTETEVIHNTPLVTDLLGNQRRDRNGYSYSPNQFVPQEFAIGKRWRTRFDIIDRRGRHT